MNNQNSIGPQVTAAGYFNSSKRVNSITSFSSFDSNNTTITDRAHKAPRGLSTDDLFSMDHKFSKPSRSRPNLQSKSISSQSLRSDRLSAPSLPRSGSMPMITGFQNGSTSDLLSFSTPMTTIPDGRRQSLKNQPKLNYGPPRPQPLPARDRNIPLQAQHIKPQHFQHPMNPPRQHQQRPQLANTFTFPNGEVYIPRRIQRNSYTNLHSLQKVQRPIQPLSQQQPLQSNQFQYHLPNNRASRPLPFQQLQKSSNLEVHASRFSLTGEERQSIPTPMPSNNKTLANDTSAQPIISNSTSPSPSGNSRSESVNESTPPSSVDDLSIGRESLNCVKGAVDVTTTPYLGKIEEATAVEIATAESNAGQSIKSTSIKSTKTVAPQPPLKLIASPSLGKPASAKVSRTHTVVSIAQPEKKRSILKKMLSRVFSKSKKKKKSKADAVPEKKSLKELNNNYTEPLSPKTPSTDVHHETPIASEPFIPEVAEAAEKGELLDVDEAFDQFSFAEGDEDQGINLKFASDFESNEALPSRFSGLSVDKHVESYADTSLSLVEPRLSLGPQSGDHKIDNIYTSNSDDAEDQVITFDDMEFIEKIIEYGETSFPDLASPDLGKSQRRAMRSKSIRRKNSVRSMSSSSRLSSNQIDSPSTVNEHSDFEDDGTSGYDVISSTEPREPPVTIEHTPSILKKDPTHNKAKSVGFANEIFVNATYPPHIYNRHSAPVSKYYSNPQIIQQIRYEMNEFKKSMDVHEESKYNTHFYRA